MVRVAIGFAAVALVHLVGPRTASAQTQRVEEAHEPQTEADEGASVSGSPAPHPDTADAAGAEAPAAVRSPRDANVLEPYTISPTVASGRGWARAVAGYDAAARTNRFQSSAEAGLTRSLALRVDFEHGPSTGRSDTPSVGMRYQALRQDAHGLDLGFGLFFRPVDFRGEGNIVGALLLGRRFGRVALLGNALVGSDTEGDDQEIDGRLATQVRVTTRLDLGVDGRWRSRFSTDAKRLTATQLDWDLGVLPNANLALGPVVLIGEAGLSVLQITDTDASRRTRAGFIALAGLGMTL